MKFSHLAFVAFLSTSQAFQLPLTPRCLASPSTVHNTCLSGHNDDNIISTNDESPKPRHNGLKKIFSRTKKSIALFTLASAATFMAAPRPAEASAPVMAMPKADARDPLTDALENHQRRMQAQAQEDLRKFNIKARQIEASEGSAARVQFEQEYKANQERRAEDRLDKILNLKYDLLRQGICPFTDMEGQRRVFEAEKGLDPAEVPGTAFYVEKEYEEKSPQKSYAYKKKANREMVRAMVEDMQNRDVDPLEYFEKHQDKIMGILDLPAAQAASLAQRYFANLEAYGQIVPPKEGEMSAKEKMAAAGKASSSTADKDEQKRLKAEAKAKAAEEKAAAKAKAKEEKARAKEEARAAKEAAKKEKEAAKAAAAAAAVAATTTTAVAATAEVAGAAAEIAEGVTSSDISVPDKEVVSSVHDTPAAEETSEVSKKSVNKIPVLKVSGVVVAVGGGGYAVKVMRDKAAADEEERQRQFKLLMGDLDDGSSSAVSNSALEEVDTGLSDFAFEDEKTRALEEPEVPSVAPKKKKRRGMKSVFGGKKNDREVDINALVSGDAKAPEFAKLLAKILTFGAPGRFPGVISLPGDMPMQEFEVDAACAMLTDSQTAAGLTKEEAAEVFANVVNCMLIDIVDLASTSLKEKDNKITVEAIGIVVDYMNHAASLYNSIAEGVVIKPVTYGGDLSKGKLEQMYSAYAASGFTNMMGLDEDFENRVSLLQDVFQISEKKAEGLMMKAMQKNMMEMMKSGEGLEGMEEMMKGMGLDGLEGGIPGMGGPSEDMDPEQLKQMLETLKMMKDTGAIPPEELDEVKNQFKEAFGSSIDDVINEANNSEGELGNMDKELLELMKAVLYD